LFARKSSRFENEEYKSMMVFNRSEKAYRRTVIL
jgi:hypothetical protein